MALEFEISAIIPGTPAEIYRSWLDTDGHTAMTGSPAEVSAEVGGSFRAWGGYISGENLDLDPEKAIVQAWRTVEFGPEEADSRLEIRLEAAGAGTRITINHSNLPAHGMQYKQGWIDNYFTPMTVYFGGG